MSQSSTERRSEEQRRIGGHPDIDGVTRGTVLEYDDWQWAVVTEIAEEQEPTRVGFVLVDDLGDAVVSVLEDAWGCAEHYDAVKIYRWSEHEYWTDAEYLDDDIWTALGPIHPDERDSEELIASSGAGNTLQEVAGTDRGEQR
mgnify:CR=1 FL=1|jgi:hypothetical protein